MVRTTIPILTAAAALLLVCVPQSLHAQQYEEQALEILRLYEDGQTDTAYWLVEPLKRNARFVPAALFVRAQMTPDDRALGLYREVIALEPAGPYADDAAYQLVRRYTAKRDSLAAWTWFGMLERTFPQSPFVAVARELLGTQKVWSFAPVVDEEEIEAATTRTVATGQGSRPTDDVVPTGSTARAPESRSDRDGETTPSESAEEFRGYALQVGLLPTRAAAERRAAELAETGLQTESFEKMVDGRSAWAVVVGPYESREAAGADKARVAKACECGAFTVLVE